MTALRAALAVLLAAMVALPGAAGADEPGTSWSLAYGGRLYDGWWETLGRAAPDGTHRAYPASGRVKGPDTWRCVSCHGWDYRGREGERGQADPDAAAPGLRHLVGVDPKAIAAGIRSEPHGYTADLIPDDAVAALAAFLSEGQHDLAAYMDGQGRATGSAEQGRAAFEGVCASCHQIDGMAFISAEAGDRPSLGWVARHKPAQALHKIRNGQPGADMVAIRFMEDSQIADLFAYVQSLDPGAD